MAGPVATLFPPGAASNEAVSTPVRLARLRLVLCGPMEAWSPGSVPVLPRARKTRALLAMLALAEGAPVPRQRLAGLLWSRRGEDQQRGSLRQAVHELTEALAPASEALVVATRDAVGLRTELVWTDAVDGLRAGRDLPPGELLADLDGLDEAFDAWLAAQRRRLLEAAVRSAGARLANATEPHAALAAAQRLLELEPTHEGAWRSLIRARCDLGDHGAALEAYERYRGLLTERFGIGPPPEMESLARGLRAAGSAPPAAFAPSPAAAKPRGPARGARLGVLPLRSVGEETDAHLATGLAEEITRALARFRWIFVADGTSLAAAAARGGEATAAAEMGLDFLLSGTVHRAGGRVRVSLQLTDLTPPATIAWSQRFDSETGDMLTLQDETAAELVARLDPEILLIEAERAQTRRHVGATGYDLLLRAIPALHRLDREGFMEAGALLTRATTLEPDYAPAFSWHAYWHLFLVGQGWGEEATAIAEAERLASRAIALDPQDAQALTIHGHVRAFLHHALREARALHDRALALNPNLAMAWVFSGMAETYLGEHQRALARLDRYKQLSPLHPHAFFFDAAQGIPLLLLHRHEEAADVARQAIALQPAMSYPYKVLLCALGHMDAGAEAAAVRRRLHNLEPGFTLARALRRNPMQRAEDRQHYEKGLRRAGLG